MPTRMGYDSEGETDFDRPFLGVAIPVPAADTKKYAGDVRGAEHITAEDTLDLDYGRLLSTYANLGKGVASPTGLSQLSTFVVRVAA